MQLEDLDIFKLLRLDQLPEKEKVAFANQLMETALTSIIVDDLPTVLTPEELERFRQYSKKEETKTQAMELLKSKFPDFNGFLKEKLLAIKKDFVIANVEERLDINKQELSEIQKMPDGEETLEKVIANEQERTKLENQLKAIDGDDWQTFVSLLP